MKDISQIVSSFNDNGFVTVTDILEPALTTQLAELCDSVAGRAAELDTSNEIMELGPNHSKDSPELIRIKSPHLYFPLFAKLIKDPFILKILTELIGQDVRLILSKINIKSPWNNSSDFKLHQDLAFNPHTNDDYVVASIFIDDCVEENGPLMVIPGSHKDVVYDHHVDGVFRGIVNLSASQYSERDIVPVLGRAGTICFHHGKLIHGSGPNNSANLRRIFFYECAAADAWPMLGINCSWEQYNRRIVCGEATDRPRLKEMNFRMPFPNGGGATIFDHQKDH